MPYSLVRNGGRFTRLDTSRLVLARTIAIIMMPQPVREVLYTHLNF
jgi:hypothetical protein